MDTKICSIDGCGKPRFSYGYCVTHANNFRVRGDAIKFPARRVGVFAHCSHADCTAPHYGKGLCRLHYRRKHEKGIPLDQTPCEVCGSATTRAGARFCSERCTSQWHRHFGSQSEAARKLRRGQCGVCDAAVHANGYCAKHGQRVKAHGDPHACPAVPAMEHCTRCGKPRGKVDVKRQGNRELCGSCYGSDYYYLNAKKERARRNARRAYQRRQTPPWADLTAIEAFYRACPAGMEVDHALPLRGRRVSGLHTLENLQYLPMTENRRKGNSA